MPRKPRWISPLRLCFLLYGALFTLHVAVHYPYATDPQSAPARGNLQAQDFYKQAYTPSVEEQASEEAYVQTARRAAEAHDVNGLVSRFVTRYGLHSKRVLDVGAGRGYLQDLVPDYTGLDISPMAQRFFHKPFVLASATAMPFRDHEFDAAWSIWVLEHIPNPESALREMRRVVKPGGLILLVPSWFCKPWSAGGYRVRRYSDFGLGGKLVKASVPVRNHIVFQFLHIIPNRAVRGVASRIGSGPTAFHYTRLVPNYKQYWEADSDAVNSMDPYEAVLWFESRGDRCLNCPGGIRNLLGTPGELVIQIGDSAAR